MNVKTINSLLALGQIDVPEMWTRLDVLESQSFQFKHEFGLGTLPTEPGLIIIRGPRQYGKSTWLDGQLRQSIRDYGAGSAYYLNGDEITDVEAFVGALLEISTLYNPHAAQRRLFIDEITAINGWEQGLKRILDQGVLRDTLIVTTGSKASDIRRGTEKLPGRKGKLPKNEFLFLPVTYREFYTQCANKNFKKEDLGNLWKTYLITGGSPLALNAVLESGRLPDYFIQLIKDWILGEVISSGRSRIHLMQMLAMIFRYAGTPVGYAKLARESGMANNTITSEYVEKLSDLLTVMPSWPWNPENNFLQLRKPCKFHFINLAAAIAFHPSSCRSVSDFDALTPEVQGVFLEWLVAQELWRRSALNNAENLESLAFWQSKTNEIDFVTPERDFVEVKRGQTSPLEFTWFDKVFPNKKLIVVSMSSFETRSVRAITPHEFLMMG